MGPARGSLKARETPSGGMTPTAFLVAFLLLALLMVLTLVFLTRSAVEAEWEGLLQTLAAEEEALRALQEAPGARPGDDVVLTARHAAVLRSAPDLVSAEDVAAFVRDVDGLVAGGRLAGAGDEAAERFRALHEGLRRQVRDYNRWTRRYNRFRALMGRKALPLIPA